MESASSCTGTTVMRRTRPTLTAREDSIAPPWLPISRCFGPTRQPSMRRCSDDAHDGRVSESDHGLFGDLFGRGAAGPTDLDWLQAMLDTEAALARAVERAGLATPGAGVAVTEAARAERFDADEIGRAAVIIGNPVSALVRALSAAVPPEARDAVHRGATSQDIIDTAMMLIARRAI